MPNAKCVCNISGHRETTFTPFPREQIKEDLLILLQQADKLFGLLKRDRRKPGGNNKALAGTLSGQTGTLARNKRQRQVQRHNKSSTLRQRKSFGCS